MISILTGASSHVFFQNGVASEPQEKQCYLLSSILVV